MRVTLKDFPASFARRIVIQTVSLCPMLGWNRVASESFAEAFHASSMAPGVEMDRGPPQESLIARAGFAGGTYPE